MRPYKRRTFLVDKKFQLKYILLVIVMLIAYTMIFVTTLFLPQILPLAFNSPAEEQVKAAEILLIYHKNVWPAVFLVIPLFGFFSIFLTHKIAGPVYRLKMKLEEMTSWNLDTKLILRNGDDLHDLAECVNQLSDELQLFVADLKSNYDTITAHIDEIRNKIETKELDDNTGRDLLLRLEASKTSIAHTLERFNIQTV